MTLERRPRSDKGARAVSPGWPSPAGLSCPVGFNEAAYLDTYPDVQVAIDLGDFASAREHYLVHGVPEGRGAQERYLYALGLGVPGAVAVAGAAVSIDQVVVAAGGTVLVVGWVDDREAPMHGITALPGEGDGWHTTAFGRVRRPDVEQALGAGPGHCFGFWALMHAAPANGMRRPWTLRVRRVNGLYGDAVAAPHFVADPEARNIILGYIAAAEHFGNRGIETVIALDEGMGDELVAFNRRISATITANPHVVRHGPQRARYAASLVVCLYGRAEFMFLQAALFQPAPGSEEHEYIFVSNSPELAEVLDKQARIAARIYGLSITVVTLAGNAGFSAANNIAARFARSPRLIIINPDVFPRDAGWARQHTAIVEGLPVERTAMFGAPLYYDDGSLMHGGMHFELDEGLSVRPGGIATRQLVRVEHYGKGAPAWAQRHATARPVPAVTGAFISADRAWFEKLGGFSEDYLFGHYEDADLCLKSLEAGRAVWLQDVRFWHMEGKGSTRLPVHEGGSLVNRWWFSRCWAATIAGSGLAGARPAHPLLDAA